MRIVFVFLFAASLFFSCNSASNIPDVSHIKIELSTRHFEKELNAMDTSNYTNQLDLLQAKYPSFGENFLATILNSDPSWSADSAAQYVYGFVTAYKKVFDTAKVVFKDFSPYENDIKKGLQYLKHYFPKYNAPKKIITYIGPLDGYGDILTDDAFVIGLQHHLGTNFSLYKSAMVQDVYPEYISNRFTPDYIVVNCMKNIIADLYPEKYEDKTLVLQMVEKGKRLFLLSKLLPKEEEYKLIGYTKKQLEEVNAHERSIWDLFVQNNFLQTNDINIIKNYIGEGPKTQELGEASPGNIGSYAGWQIVKKFMVKNPNLDLKELMETDSETVFQQAKYKP